MPRISRRAVLGVLGTTALWSVGSAIVQYDTKARRPKVIAFLHPFYQEKYGLVPKGTYGVACDPAGDKLYITWNVSRGSRAWDSCGVTTIHIPESERTT